MNGRVGHFRPIRIKRLSAANGCGSSPLRRTREDSETPLGILLAENLPFVCSPMGIDDSVIASAAAAGSTACALYPGRANAATDRILAQPRLDVSGVKFFRTSGESDDSDAVDDEDVRYLHDSVQRLHLAGGVERSPQCDHRGVTVVFQELARILHPTIDRHADENHAVVLEVFAEFFQNRCGGDARGVPAGPEIEDKNAIFRQALLSVKTEHSQQVAGGTMKLSALVAKSHANPCLNNTSFTELVGCKTAPSAFLDPFSPIRAIDPLK